VTQGETPSVTDNSTLTEDATVTYEADDSMADTVEVEAGTDNLELQVRPTAPCWNRTIPPVTRSLR